MTVVLSMTMSLDGVVGAAGPEQWWPVHEKLMSWQFAAASWRAKLGMDGGEDSADSRLLAEHDQRIGAYVMGRSMFDFGEEPWGDEPPFGAPVVVVTHRERDPLHRTGTGFSFETGGVAAAVAAARRLAGDRDVQVSGGASVARQALDAGLVDELDLHIAPVVVGDGLHILDLTDPGGPVLVPLAATTSSRAAHLSYRVTTSDAVT